MRNKCDEVGSDYEELTGEFPEYLDKGNPQIASSATSLTVSQAKSSVQSQAVCAARQRPDQCD